MLRTHTLLLLTFSVCLACQPKSERVEGNLGYIQPPAEVPLPPRISQLGKTRAKRFEALFQRHSLDTLPLPLIDYGLLQALRAHRSLLDQPKRRENYQIGNLRFTIDQLRETVEILQSRQHSFPVEIADLLDAYQVWGNDQQGNVLFTGYFTPIIPVSKVATAEFCHPIYDRPSRWEGKLPSRREIEEEGALDSLDLEIAYARSKVDIYYMQVQGSGFVEYRDGSRQLLSYNGTNRHPFRSIERFLLDQDRWPIRNVSIDGIKAFFREYPELRDSVLFHDPSYTFFRARFTEPKGAGGVPLSAHFTVAADRRYLPLGTCLLAAIPIFDKAQNRVIRHEYRIVLAQDVGGRIKGPGHVDLYFGVGEGSRKAAMRMKFYGKLWLLLPKPPEPGIPLYSLQ